MPKSLKRLVLCLALATQSVFAQVNTAFTIQGHLRDRATAADGRYDLRFSLFTAASNGNAFATITNDKVLATQGLFNATLDFGSAPFDGTPYWLEIGVRTNGSADDFTTLSSRQPLAPTPYAIYALQAGTATTVTGVVLEPALPQLFLLPKTFMENLTFLDGAQLIGPRMENASSPPAAATTATAGRIYFDSLQQELMFSDGAQWRRVGQRRIAYAAGAAEDSRQSGTVTGRTLNFTKASATSRLRITYSDNFGMASFSGGKAACWTVNIDGSAISNPAPIRVCLYANVGTTSGSMRRADTVVGYAVGIGAGAHSLSVTVAPAPGYEGTANGIVTGWPDGGSSFLLEVEELP